MQNSEMRHFVGSEIAVIGMACHFPKSKDIASYLENLQGGVNCISFLTNEELEPSGVDPSEFNHPDYVKAASVLEDVELFDAAFFGITPNEALVMDPQHRLFLQCAWSALENAGYNPDTYDQAIGVFAGARTSSYLFNIYSNPDIVAGMGSFEIGLGNDLGFLSTRTSYKLNLKGPSYSVHTACSTSLVAVHLACRSLLVDECQIALAGGVAVNVPHKTGYLYRRGSIYSPDGHCRVFDENAEGTLFGSGVGIVVLKRLEDAMRDQDHIYAVIRGSATNNDGSAKASFSAPSVQGQSRVILDALTAAGVDPETIGYVEAHGTGTPIGDPIEMRALTGAFRAHTAKRGFCAIGSVKSNLGHLDAAAGVASLIKSILSLRHKKLLPSIDFVKPNPEIRIEETPFYVNVQLKEWESNGQPRRAGVSSFGLGGTNAHLVLEEAPQQERQRTRKRDWELLVWSARSETALEQMTRNLREYLKEHGEGDLGDVAYTLQTGRRLFRHRRMLVCRDGHDAIEALEAAAPDRVLTVDRDTEPGPVIFVFPGQGCQYINMGKELYSQERVFREQVDRCAEILRSELGLDMREILYPAPEKAATAASLLDQIRYTNPILFTLEYALARLWLAWGVRPFAVIGHSTGEFAAACISEVLSLEDALRLVSARGRLMQQMPNGCMTGVLLPEEQLESLLVSIGGVSLAAVNSPSACVVSGNEASMTELERMLMERGVLYRRLHISHAGHSSMMDPILEDFRKEVQKAKFREPVVPYVSNLSGTWATSEVTDPEYWVRHLRQPVRFSDGIAELLRVPRGILLEVGPGRSLGSLIAQHPARRAEHIIAPSLPHPKNDPQGASEFLLATVGQLWQEGVPIQWKAFHDGEPRPRIPLPTYPFEGERYWLEPQSQSFGTQSNQPSDGKNSNIEEWFFLPAWKRSLQPMADSAVGPHLWIVFSDQSRLASELVEVLRQEEKTVFIVEKSVAFMREGEHLFFINPAEREHYVSLLKTIPVGSALKIVHLWSISEGEEVKSSRDLFESIQPLGYYSLLYLSQALVISGHEAQISVVSDHAHDVDTGDLVLPEKQPMVSVCKVIPQEISRIGFCCLDLDLCRDPVAAPTAAAIVLAEANAPLDDMLVAYRGGRRFVFRFEPVRLNKNRRRLRTLKERGVYVITGGFGGVAKLLSEHLAEVLHARLLLMSRTPLPEAGAWADYLEKHPQDDETSCRIRHVQRLEELGAKVIVACVNVADAFQLNASLDRAQNRFGAINGVFHTAGITSGESLYRSFTELGVVHSEIQFEPKVYGVYALRQALHDRNVGFCMMFSSNASILGGLGYLTYAAANGFMDSFSHAQSQDATAWISVNWDPWPEETKKYSGVRTGIDQYAMSKEESVEAVERVLAFCPPGQVVVATGDLEKRLSIWTTRAGDSHAGQSSKRPNLRTKYVPPADEIEKKIAGLWEKLLGIEQIGTYDNFFDLGGHSLLTTRLISQLRDAGFAVTINEFFAGPTIAAVAELVRKQHDSDDAKRAAILDMLEQLSDEEVASELRKRSMVQQA